MKYKYKILIFFTILQLVVASLIPFLIGCNPKYVPVNVPTEKIGSIKAREDINVISDLIISTPVTINKDWIITPKNRIVRVIGNGHINGTGTIYNGIWDIGEQQNVFDTSVKFNPYGMYRGGLSVMNYGASSLNPDNYGAIQTTFDCGIRNSIPIVVNKGVFNYGKTLELKNIYKGQYVGCTVNISGVSTIFDANDVNGSVLKYNSTIGYAFTGQMLKGGSIDGLTIEGKFKSPIFINDSVRYNTAFEDYHDANGLCGELYAGFVIDPDGSKNLGGSSGTHFSNLHVRNFTIDYLISPNAKTFNADCLTFDIIRGGDCKTVFATGQAQEKGNVIKNLVMWDNCHTVIMIGWYGKRQAGNYTFDGGNIANKPIRFMYIQAGNWNSTVIKNYFVESLGEMGMYISNVPITLENNTFNCLPPEYIGYRRLLYANSAAIKFKNCIIQYNNGQKQDLPMNSLATMEGCYLSGKIVLKN